MLFILLIALFQTTNSYNISVYGDVFKDVEFFTRTFPWIIDNIGGEVTVEFFLLGSGRHTVPQMCVLEELRNNAFLQAQYLKCEAEGSPSDYCLCETGIDPQVFKQCVRNQGYLASVANVKFTEVGIDVTPLVELGPRITVFGVKDSLYLKKICTIFGDSLPRGCTKPFACNGTDVISDRRSLAQFDKCCDVTCCSTSTTETRGIDTDTTPMYEYTARSRKSYFDNNYFNIAEE